MQTVVGVERLRIELKTWINAAKSERVVILRRGYPAVALVPMRDLKKLESLDEMQERVGS